jgi:RNA polymerase sigma-70 factor (ECF subfamily)
MTTDALDVLLEKLTAGDLDAAEQVFRDYEPYIRKVVRRHLPERLRPKFDSIDVVQSVWANFLQDFRESGRRFASSDHLRNFLVLVTRHRLTDRIRRHHRAMEREEPLATAAPEDMPTSREPRPSQLAQADELWERMLALCPPEYHQLLELKRQGLSLDEIAAQTGLHEGSVRRILRKLAGRLAFQEHAAAAASDDAS